MQPVPTGPKVLISYSHDTPAHEAMVLALSDRLRQDGIDSILDQYEPFPPQGSIRWVSRRIEEAQFVIVDVLESYTDEPDESVS